MFHLMPKCRLSPASHPHKPHTPPTRHDSGRGVAPLGCGVPYLLSLTRPDMQVSGHAVHSPILASQRLVWESKC
jgi:hypothetical protein